jgi:tetrahydromethanopterin S-methyltransferase subunit G
MKSIPEISIDTLALIERLETVNKEREITYRELSDLIGRDVQHEARSNLARACRRLERDQGIVFGVVRGVGLKRLSDAVIVEGTAAQTNRSIARKIKRAAKRIALADDEQLKPEQRQAKRAALAMFSTVAFFTKESERKKINLAAKEEKPLSVGRVLELCKHKAS